MSSRFEQNRREERRRRGGEREAGGGWWCLYRGCSMRAFLPWMDAVVSLRVRDWVKRGGGGGGKRGEGMERKKKEYPQKIKRKSKMIKRTNRRLRSSLQPQMHRVPSECRCCCCRCRRRCRRVSPSRTRTTDWRGERHQMWSWSIKSLLLATVILTPAETACNQLWLQ